MRVLRDDEAIRARLDRVPRRTPLSDLWKEVDRAEAAGHVRDVDPPAVEVVRRLQPASRTTETYLQYIRSRSCSLS